MLKQVVVTGAFDDLRSRHLRFLQEAAKLGPVTALLWPDEVVQALAGSAPKFPLAERLYVLNAVRYVTRVIPLAERVNPTLLPPLQDLRPDIWADEPGSLGERRKDFCRQHGLEYRLITPEAMAGFPEVPTAPPVPSGRKVVVTGCFDWLHSGHVRFFEEVSTYGSLYVVVGHDANIRLLKGEGHPLLPQEERRYLTASIRYVAQSLVSTGHGWLDADPEIQRLKPDIFAVNEDGDRGGKREHCARLGMEYLVLKRIPAPGLTQRSSTNLRGF
jgi:cytidyltransferase-like protein